MLICGTYITQKLLYSQVNRFSGAALSPVQLVPVTVLTLTLFSWLGMMQRTKLGFVFLSVAISLDSCSLYSCPTVRNMPFLVL